MSASIFFSGRIEEAIAATVANRKPLVCFVTDDSDDSDAWEQDYLSDESVSTILKDSSIAVRLLKESTEANYLNAFCAITTYPTLLIIKNGGAGVDGLTIITTPISKEDFVSRIESAFTSPPPQNIMAGVNSNPTFPATPPTATTPTTAEPTTSQMPRVEMQEPERSGEPATVPNNQFPSESATARRLASIQQQHRERIARLKAEREAAILEAQKKRELSRREETKAIVEAAETQKGRGNRQYVEEQKKRREEAEKERKRVLEQIRADREDMRIREANRKAIEQSLRENEENGQSSEWKGKGKKVISDGTGECKIAFRLLDGSRISHKFHSENTIEGDVRPWLDRNRTDGNHPYKLVQSGGMPSKRVDDNATLSDLGLYPSAILILKPIASSKISTAFAPARKGGHNFIVAFLLSIWMFLKTFLGMHNPNAMERVGEVMELKNLKGKEVPGSSSSVPARDIVKKRIRTLHDGNGDDKRSAYYNGNQLDFEPKKKGESETDEAES